MSKRSYIKYESFKKNFIARIYVAISVAFGILFCCAVYALNVNSADVRKDITKLNKDITYSLNNSFDEIKSHLYLQAFLSEVNGARLIKDGKSKEQFRSLYLLDVANDEVVDKFEYVKAHKITNFEMSFLSKLATTDFVISKFVFAPNEEPYFYAAYKISDQYFIIAEVNMDFFLSRLKDELGYKFHNSYITDGKNFISGREPELLFQSKEFKRDLSKGDDLVPTVRLDYVKSTGYMASYDARYGLYVVSFYVNCLDIMSIAVLAILITLSTVIFLVFLLKNISLLKEQLIEPMQKLIEFLDSNGDNSIAIGSDIEEMQSIKKGIYRLYKQMQKTNDILKDNQERYGYLFERSTINIIVYDAYSGQIIEASNSALELYGYSRGEILSLNILDLADFSMRDILFTRQIAKENGTSYTVKQFGKNGRVIEASINISEINLSDGKRLKFLIIKDIGKKLRRRRNVDVIEQYSNMMVGAVMVASKDEPFKIINATKSIQDIFGINYDVLLESGFDLRDSVIAADKNAFINEIEMNKRLFGSGASGKDRLRLIVRIKGANDRVAPYRINVRFSRDMNGNFNEIVYSASDYSEHQQLIEKRELESKISRSVVWATGAVSFEWDRTTDIVTLGDNYAQMLGYESMKELGLLNYERIRSMLLVDKSAETSEQFLANIAIDKDTFGGDIATYRKDGSIIWVRVRAKVTERNEEGKVLKISGALEDISGERNNLFYKNVLASIFSYSDLGIVILDTNGNIIDANDAFANTMGYTHAELVGNNINLFRSGLHGIDFYDDLWRDLEKNGLYRARIWSRTSSAEDILQSVTLSSISDEDGANKFILATFSNINNDGVSKDYLEHIAYHDPLTKLPNRFLFTQRLESILLEMNEGEHLAVIYLDLDGFKSINDNYGHRIGDAYLVDLSSRLDILFDEQEVLARFGVDEFGAIVKYESRGQIDEIVANMLRIASSKIKIEGVQIGLSASIGVSLYERQYGASDMLEQADWAMYQAKLAGKNRFYVFDARRDRHFKRQYDDSIKLFRALESGELFLQYQPQIDIAEGRVVAFEALLRWRSEDGVIYPENFLPYLKNQSVLDEIALFCIKEALYVQYLYASKHRGAKVSVNVSLAQICKDDFFDKFNSILSQNPHLDVSMLEFELCDAGEVRYLEGAHNHMVKYKNLGVRFVLDDFASGDSSLEALQILDVDEIKLSKSFCKNLLSKKTFLQSIKIIRDLQHIFKVQASAKGIEDMATLRILSALGFEIFQGYVIHEPMFVDEVMKYEFKELSELDISYLMQDDEFQRLCECVQVRQVASKIVREASELSEHEKKDIEDELRDNTYFSKFTDILISALKQTDIAAMSSLAKSVEGDCLNYIQSVGTDRIREQYE
ncbi:EAL domain-containing protein [Campylobacter sp. 19-13652]|uniref:EAL domain-containing protein n=1 Tax=Campylobacter sp. 19-13652 TaxID=2840180 RepID=UPI001C7879FE|nr:EAL domain-containing protein [Campylobacter sp. 19-13652]BCX80106.1 hypothetical protein LBC_15680 [Campylobacter sp. 19-13652]